MAVLTSPASLRDKLTHDTALQDRQVPTCYSVLDVFFPRLGLFDLTEGIYDGSQTTFEKAQINQRDYLLEQSQCHSGHRLLDIGCGYGTLLSHARLRGLNGVGITLSQEQARHARRAGLDVRVHDYKSLGPDWDHSFDSVIANGSLEHFARPADAAESLDDGVYREMFRIVHRLIDPASTARRFVTTAIHVVRLPTPADVMRHPLFSRFGSDAYHFALLARGFGGWYPQVGQLERCAAGYFDLVTEVDGTEDYRRTSEEWLSRVRRALRSWNGVRIGFGMFPTLLMHPIQTPTLLWSLLASESWNWQFRPPAPTCLLRQTWSYRER